MYHYVDGELFMKKHLNMLTKDVKFIQIVHVV